MLRRALALDWGMSGDDAGELATHAAPAVRVNGAHSRRARVESPPADSGEESAGQSTMVVHLHVEPERHRACRGVPESEAVFAGDEDQEGDDDENDYENFSGDGGDEGHENRSAGEAYDAEGWDDSDSDGYSEDFGDVAELQRQVPPGYD